ncbi:MULTISPECIES: nitroreductase family protein [unclassified Leifsonia]|uniref:nitroreductase family protein n=1 Tax=unclassified Leifsonia TaxID=2663824 RepID=UPI0008A7BF99|nr:MULTISPECIES: nitroreductase family protein [unclassified Leifsonia]SEI10982.1 Nitroreductase [Leifsonia sp. CL154]SFL89803.1 Nitroreductase [Leifsonia sp. CL147]
MSIAEAATRTADTSAPLLTTLAERWSPRAFDPSAEVDETVLRSALEAARWSPSASNTQPWRFIVARRGTAEFDTIVANLQGFNQAWAGAAAVLIVAAAEVVDADGRERRWATYDLGQAVAHLTIQAHHDGLYAHQMGGFEPEGLRQAFDLDERFEPVSVTAIGVLGDPESLPDPLRERESAPRSRRPLEDIVRYHG